jgi:hypothetical protein
MQTLRELAAALDHLLLLCEAVATAPKDRGPRLALDVALSPFADRAFPQLCRAAAPELYGLANMVHVQAVILRERLSPGAAEPPEFATFLVNKAEELLTTLPELQIAFARHLPKTRG